MMKVIIVLASLILSTFCQDTALHLYHYSNGKFSLNKASPAAVSGVMFSQFEHGTNYSLIAGEYHNSTFKSPFQIITRTVGVYPIKDGINIKAECYWGFWKKRDAVQYKGHVEINITAGEISIHANCDELTSGDNLDVKASAKESECHVFTPAEAADRAATLHGEPITVYKAYNVLNMATMGFFDVGQSTSCSWYSSTFKTTTEAKPGMIIVGVDGEHCAIINKKGDAFIQANPVTGKVSENSMSMINAFFRKGYVLKDYPCKVF